MIFSSWPGSTWPSSRGQQRSEQLKARLDARIKFGHDALKRRRRYLTGLLLALTLAGCEYWPLPPAGAPQVNTLACNGDFVQFANGYPIARLMELSFVVDWATPAVTPINGGGATRVIALNAIELSFEVQYEGYKAAYHLDRVQGIFSQRPNLGGVFFGRCYLKPYQTVL